MELPEISIIGLGGLGTALTKTLSARGIPIKSIYNRSEDKASDLAAEIGINSWGDFPHEPDELGNLVFVTVADRAIEEVAGRLLKLDGDFEEFTFVHCSGNESADLLDGLKVKGATIASFHPLQTFTAQSQPDDFTDIYFSMQGEPQAFPVLKKVARLLEAHTLEVNQEQKAYLHAAAVMASNYLNTLLDASVEIGTLGDLTATKVKNALLPLVKTTLKNSEEHSFAEALTGPIKRGDIQTVKNHLALLDDHNELRRLYCSLGLHTLRLAETKDYLDGTTVAKLRKILR